MTNEEAINVFETELECITRDCDMDCEDCDFIVKYEDFKESRNLAIEALKNLPSKQPKQKCGRWLISSDGYYPYCSNCKTQPKDGNMTKFCPNCGIKMDWKDYE